MTTGSTDTRRPDGEFLDLARLWPPTTRRRSKKIDTASQETGKSLDCKKFFPSAGMTLSVPCE